MWYIGIDIGSVSVNVALMDEEKKTLRVLPYTKHYGDSVRALKNLFGLIVGDIKTVNDIKVTGTGGKLIAPIIGAGFVNELPAQIEAARRFYKEARTIIDIGGEDSKFIDITKEDYAMNELCAAGTGSFLEQQASRLGISIEKFSEMALMSKSPPRIAGRYTVFAKTDMIHLQQEATPDYEIVAGLCFALARNFTSEIAKGRKIISPVLFHGGVAFNKGMVKAFREVLAFQDNKLIVPEHCAEMSAIGAAIIAVEERKRNKISIAQCIDEMSSYMETHKFKWRSLQPLSILKSKLPDYKVGQASRLSSLHNSHRIDAFIGVDVGSISTNVVAIDRNKNLIEKVYLMTAGRPIEAVRMGIRQLGEKVGKHIRVVGAATTGSGRYLTGDFIGADVVVNEITAQARAAVHIEPEVDTVFEIGGQDSKYISIENRAIVDFEMNKVCAAGTGSFLEEQAERLAIKIEEFGDIALKAPAPCDLGERCTVFMETNLVSYQRKGTRKEDLVAGLCYSIAKNYLSQVVGRKHIGKNILFQGAVAFNKGVVSAFEKILDTPITVPPNHHVTGAIGAAIAAMENGGRDTKFKGFDVIPEIKYTQEIFECEHCPNHCEVKKVTIGEKTALFYGARCERYEQGSFKRSTDDIPNLFLEREQLLLSACGKTSSGPRIGIPYASIFLEFLPFWYRFLSELGFEVVLSDKTNKRIIHDGVSASIAEFCFPIKLVHGHVIDLLEKGVDFLFLPSIIDTPPPAGMKRGYICPYNQEIPHIIMASLRPKTKILHPVIFFRSEKNLTTTLIEFGRKFGKSTLQVRSAIDAAKSAQDSFYKRVKLRGEEIMDEIDEALILVGRPYNTCDEGASLEVPRRLRQLGKFVIPMDFLPLLPDILSSWPSMYWTYGYKILSAARTVKNDPRLHAVFMTNFACGPDSFILQYFRKEMSGKPFLQIEVDEHSAPAGVITRCEAFLDSIKNAPSSCVRKSIHIVPKFRKSSKRTVYLPHLGDSAWAPCSAFNKFGIPAEVISSDDETLELGRKYTTGKECYPCVITTGDMIKILKYKNPKEVAFLMPTTYGPCRFGQYCRLQRLILDELGYKDVPIISPGVPESVSFFKEYGMLSPSGVALIISALKGVITIDYLLRMRREKRPYEIEVGKTDKVYGKYLKEVCRAIQDGGIEAVLKNAAEEFATLPTKHKQKPRIAIVGEIFVRSHDYSNNSIERRVEEYGGEVMIPPFYEWGLHTSGTRRMDAQVEGRIFPYYLTYISEFLIRYFERSLLLPVNKTLRTEEKVKIHKIWGAAEPYLIKWFGEPALSIGDCVLWARKKEIDGIINLMPFTCMPGNITAAAFKGVEDDYGLPVLNIAFDGLEQGTLETRLETFMYRVKRHKTKGS
ncbi:MAG: CoA activase [bacterium (Candidatus Stahlbacteria) CG23_combo_of_CG06-09_8_20_14_all_40_9]|nr:MAG: CoA activase [bacterium (Candidatus Stahlbacteria) CG23_combo_of_CG06-09_8_20_14_all_40_9]